MTLSLPITVTNTIEDALVFNAPDPDNLVGAHIDAITRAILIRQWEEFVYQYTVIKFDPDKHCIVDDVDDTLSRLAYDWVMSRTGQGDIFGDNWGKRWGKKLAHIAKYQGTLHMEYDYDQKLVTLGLVR